MRPLLVKLVVILLLVVYFPAWAQNGYIVTSDSTYSEGYVIDLGMYKNNRRIGFMPTDESPVETYLPQDLMEFGVDNEVYITRVVPYGATKAGFFLYRILKGKTTLYKLKMENGRRLFAERSGQIVEMDRSNFRDRIRDLFGNDDLVKRQVGLVKYGKRSLTRYFQLYDRGFDGLMPAFRKGIFAGLGTVSNSMDQFNETVRMGTRFTPSIGVFADFPVGMNPHWYVNAKLSYQASEQVAFQTGRLVARRWFLKTSSLSMPVLLKYRSTTNTIRKFIVAGPAFGYVLKARGEMLLATTSLDVISITKTQFEMNKRQIGGAVGVGGEYSLSLKRIIAAELMYTRLAGSGEGVRHGTSAIQLVTSLYF